MVYELPIFVGLCVSPRENFYLQVPRLLILCQEKGTLKKKKVTSKNFTRGKTVQSSISFLQVLKPGRF